MPERAPGGNGRPRVARTGEAAVLSGLGAPGGVAARSTRPGHERSHRLAGGGLAGCRRGVDDRSMVGGRWVPPGASIDGTVEATRPDGPVAAGSPSRFPCRSEPYYMPLDPSDEVSAPTRFGARAPWEDAHAGHDEGPRAVPGAVRGRRRPVRHV